MDEPRIPDEAMARAILAQALGAEVRAVERFPTGNHHYVYDCRLADGGQAVVRIAAAHSRAAMAGAAQCSDLLRPLGVPLPEILARGEAEGLLYLVLERLPGTDLGHVITLLTPEQRRAIACEIARIQDVVASLPAANRYGYAVRPEHAPHGTWTAALHAMLDRSGRRIEQAGVVDPECVARVRAAVERAQGMLDRKRPRCFLHDTTTKNVIVNEGRLTGIVDVDDFCFGDPLLAPALTLTSLLQAQRPIDYVLAWVEAARLSFGDPLLLYVAIFCVDFLAEIGHSFNGNNAEKQSKAVERLQAFLIYTLGKVA
jgi:aminoglycoside phosphotransferase (APT) family kinase protein